MQKFIYHVEIHIDNPQYFCVCEANLERRMLDKILYEVDMIDDIHQ
jgi:hypothetical protein